MISKKFLLLIPVLALFGQGCLTSADRTSARLPVPVAPTPISAPSAPTPSAVCAETPQVYFFNKLAFSAVELANIRTNVVDPLIAYYASLEGQTVVSIMIKRTDTGINVEAIVDMPDTIEPSYQGFVHPRTGSRYPRWVPEELPPGYQG